MTATRITVSRSDFRKVVMPDPHADTSYLEQGGFEDRLAEFNSGSFSFIGVRADVEVLVPMGNGVRISQTITSGGLWGIEDDSGSDYIDSEYQEQADELADILETMGFEVVA